MSRDTYHDIVVEALKKDGWTITNDPLYVQAGSRKLRIDIGAERLIGAEKEGEKIAVEIKSFMGVSALHEFYKAIGQFDYYAFALNKQEKDRILYLETVWILVFIFL